MKIYFMFFLLILTIACSSDSNPFSVEPFVFEPGSENELVIFNATRRTIYTIAIERGALAFSLLTFYICPNGPEGIKPSQEYRMKIEDIFGYQPDSEVVLYWWVASNRKNESGCYEPDLISSVVLTPQDYQPNGVRVVISGFTSN